MKIFIRPFRNTLLITTLFVGFVQFSYAQHADIWLTLIDNQISASEVNSETNNSVAVDLTTGKFLFPAVFGTFSDPRKTDQPGFQSLTNTFNPNDFLYYRAVGSLWFWNGQTWVNETPDQEKIKIRDVLYSDSTITDLDVSNPLGAIAQINENGSIHQHIDFFIEPGASADPAIGAYMIDIEFFATNTPGGNLETHLSSDPVRIAFNYQMSESEFSDAINALTSPPELGTVSVPMPNGALFLLAVVLLIFGSYQKRLKSIVR
ncbi:MAG: hypothetical protein P8M71_04620 [Pseudomonadales bacterium]|nr:hypothetical protein [Pseudomonadales bacterium]